MAVPRMMLVVVLTAIFTAHYMGSSGEIHELMRAALGQQLSALLSSCCVVRGVRCPASPLSVSYGLALHVQRQRWCSLSFPSSFLPDTVDGVSYNVTFVNVRTTSKYKCTYRGTRTLNCDRVRSMSTAMVRLAAPGLVGGPRGALAALGSGSLWGEDLAEAMESMMESGILPSLLSPRGRGCGGRCAPLRCMMSVVGEGDRFIEAVPSPDNPPTQRQRFHQCLRQNSVQPPHSPVTTMRTDSLLPEKTHRNDDHSYPLGSSQKTDTSTTTTTTTTTTTITTTTKIPTPFSTTHSPPPSFPPTSVVEVSTMWIRIAENSTTTHVPGMATGSSSTTGMLLGESTTVSANNGSGLEEVTRSLVVGPTTTSKPPKDYHAVEDGDGQDTAAGGVEVPGVVAIGVATAAGVLATCLFCCFLARRRRQKRKEALDSGGHTQPGKQGSTVVGGHYKTRPLPHVSFKKVFVKSSGSSEDPQKAGSGSRQWTREQKATSTAQRYTTPGFMTASSQPSLQPSVSGEGGESLYASLDEANMIPSDQPLSVISKQGPLATGQNGVSRLSKNGEPYAFKQSPEETYATDESAVYVQPGRQGSSRYYNMKLGASSSKSSPCADNAAACRGGNRASYVNVSPATDNVYEQPRQPDQHEYSRLSNGRVAAHDADDVDQDGYLVPATSPAK